MVWRKKDRKTTRFKIIFNADLEERVNALLQRAVIFSQFSAIGSNFVTDDKMQKLDYFPPIHSDGCACIVKNSLTKQEKTTITQQYKKFNTGFH